MTKKEFIFEASHFIFKEVAKNTNALCGKPKTSTTFVNLIATLPLKIEARYISTMPVPSTKLNALDKYVHAYLKHDDVSTVYIAFFYSDESQFKQILSAVQKHPAFFAYLYMREALKAVRLMNTATHYRMMSGLIKKKRPDISVNEHYMLSQLACNYAINLFIKQLFAGSSLSSIFGTIIARQSYNADFAGKSEQQILLELLDTYVSSDPIELDGVFSYSEWANEIFDKAHNPILTNESILTNLGESVSSNLATMSRGEGSASIFAEFFQAKKVETGWFKRLSAKFKTDVYNRTNTFRSEWSNINITYRKHFKSPKVTYEDNKLSVVLSIDHSGSVSTEGLPQLLYIFQTHSKNISQLIVIIHATEVVKTFTLNSQTDIKNDSKFLKALGCRFAVGGTSHYKVFKHIDQLIKNKKIDPSKSVYVSFSDNYSDIPDSWKAFPRIHRLSTTFLAPVQNPVNIAGTSDIAMS